MLKRYADVPKNSNRTATTQAVNGLRTKSPLEDDHNDVVPAKDLLRGQGTLRLLKRENVVWLVFSFRIVFGI